MSFFAERGLADDALQELFSIAEPSPEIQQRQAEVVKGVCSTEESEQEKPDQTE